MHRFPFGWASSKLCQAFNGGQVQSGSRLPLLPRIAAAYERLSRAFCPLCVFYTTARCKRIQADARLCFLAQSLPLIALFPPLLPPSLSWTGGGGLLETASWGKRSEGSPHPKQQPAMPLGDIHASKPQISPLLSFLWLFFHGGTSSF